MSYIEQSDGRDIHAANYIIDSDSDDSDIYEKIKK